jgi:hypothetical protein
MEPISSRFFGLMHSRQTRRSLASSLPLHERNKTQNLASRGWPHSKSCNKFGVYFPLCVKAGNVKLSWQPILGIMALALSPFMQKWLRRGRLRVLGERTVAAWAEPDSSNTKYDELVANLSGNPISPAGKDAFFSSLSVGQDQLHVFT